MTIPVMIYLMFGDQVLEEFVLNLYNHPNYSKALNGTIIWLTIIVPISKYALLTRPVSKVFEQALVSKDQQNTPFHVRFLVRTALGLGIVSISAIYPHFINLIGIVGSLFSFFITLVFPCVCHLSLFKGTLSLSQRIVDWALIAIGIVGGIAGLIACIYRDVYEIRMIH